ncbi:transporter [Microbacterium sp. P01]|uniref:transporter n=1 Tax=Microbacterium sp. P01 TaxID=3366261 RepID=UPI00366BC226
MVATLLRLRLRVLGNSLTRSTWQLVATVIGGLYGLGMLVAVAAGAVALGLSASFDLAATIIVLAGSLLTLGWVLFPLLLTGIEQTLDPPHLVQYPIPMRTLLIALTLAGVIGIPGAVSLLAGLASAAAWLRSPPAMVAAVLCAVIGVVTAVVASRAMAALSVGLQSSRRARELSGILIIIPLLLLGPIIIALTQGISSSAGALPNLASALGWTPLGAAWAVPGAIAVGDIGGAGLRLLIALATLVLLYIVWRGALARALVTPAVATNRSVSRGKLGVFARVPQTPAGAIAARCLTYWRRDPRYARQLISVPLIPVLLWFYSILNDAPVLVMWTGPLLGFTFALTLASDISYDGTAFATHLIDGVRGRDDRLGRLSALAVFAVPITLLAAVGGVAFADQWQHLPVILALSIGTMLTGMGVVCISSARFVMPVPRAGDNPFKSAQGSSFTTGLQVFAVWGIVLAIMIPTGVLAIISFASGSAVFGWSALACSVVIGVAVLIIGIRGGGALLDRTGPTLLMQLRRLRGA